MAPPPPSSARWFFCHFIFWMIAVFGLVSSLQAKVYTVSNATDFNNLPRLNAGDVVQMNSGTYGALNKTWKARSRMTPPPKTIRFLYMR